MNRASAGVVAAVMLGCLALASRAFAAEWQWSALVRSIPAGQSRAFLWIPPNCQRVRAVVLAQHNMEEISILEHPKFRAALAHLAFAEVWCVPAFDPLFRFNEGAGEIFTQMMETLARESGYAELEFAPVVGLGHSAAASWPYYFAAWNPERTLAAISVSGQWPYFRDPKWAPDIWGDRNIDFIPCLETMGEYESADTWSAEGLKERRQHPRLPLSMLACPAEGHFAATDRKVEYLALYLRKAAQYRLPVDAPTIEPPKLRPLDPTRTGWLAEKWRLNQAPMAPAAPVASFTGDPAQAFWFFDEELARATERYQAQYRGLKATLLGYLQNGAIVAQRDTHQQVNLQFQPQSDGVTFKLSGGFLDTVPRGSPRPAKWTGLPAGSPLGHASSGGPIGIERICGPFAQVESNTFELRFDRTGFGDGRRALELWFAAKYPGGADYKPAVQQAQMFVPIRNTEGPAQHITFNAIPDQEAGVKSLPLTATSDAGTKVRFFVREGPAEVEGHTLRFTTIPPRAKLPLQVSVVAWQFGRATEPPLQSAEPITRTFRILRGEGRLGTTTGNEANVSAATNAFLHPGLLHTTADFERMQAMLARQAEPWKSGFEKLKTHKQSQADWRLRGPFAGVVRDPRDSRHIAELDADANAAYQSALMWCLTTNQAHARKAIEILNAWSGTLREITGRDKELGASLAGNKLVNAAELLRHTDSGWQPQDVARFERMLRDVFSPVIRNFATFANGNWGAGCIKTMLAMGVFLEDHVMFERALHYYRHGSGNGALAHYIVIENGQCQESGRDQQHTQLGLGHLAETCEMAWHQGLNLYAEAANRLLRGFEFTAQYNLGQEVPFTPWTDQTGKYAAKTISSKERGQLRPIFEMVWNHYERRRGLPAPWTRQAAEKIRPEGATQGADHPGFGTLLFFLPPTTRDSTR